jgi:hypothetical protein
MPTKPDAITDLPPAWASNGNYSAGVYGPTLPWGDANPLAGQPLPWGGQPRLNTTGLTSFCNTGLAPQVPTDASSFNEFLRRVAIWASNWVAVGTSAADADAHIMETDVFGFSAAVKYIATSGVEGAGATPVALPQGATVPSSKAITGAGSTSTDLHVGDSFELDSETAATGDRQIHHLGGEPRWKDSDDDYIHHGTEPWGPVGSVPALDSFGPTSAEIDGPTTEVTLTGTAFVFVAASGIFLGTAADTEAGIRVEVDGVDVYDQTFEVFNTERPLVWSTSFAVQEGAGTFDVKIKFRRSAGTASVNLAAASIFAMPT